MMRMLHVHADLDDMFKQREEELKREEGGKNGKVKPPVADDDKDPDEVADNEDSLDKEDSDWVDKDEEEVEMK